jgi:hypothetical protein
LFSFFPAAGEEEEEAKELTLLELVAVWLGLTLLVVEGLTLWVEETLWVVEGLTLWVEETL